mgnify:FL=1
MRTTCAAPDDIARPLGDPTEASLRSALDFIAGRSCTPVIAGQVQQADGQRSERRVVPLPKSPNVAQREVPGLF